MVIATTDSTGHKKPPQSKDGLHILVLNLFTNTRVSWSKDTYGILYDGFSSSVDNLIDFFINVSEYWSWFLQIK